ncbi:MAG: GTPase Era [Pseudomonadota bacterium]
MTQRCGFVAIVGRPNVGKSTLLNHVLRQKISITSRKPQTTRHNLTGVDTEQDRQALYIDTPGLHRNVNKALNKYMVSAALAALKDVDVIVMVVEAGRWREEDDWVLAQVARYAVPRIAVLNKVDLLARKADLLPEIAQLSERGVFDEIIPLSALKSDGVESLRAEVFKRLPEGVHHFDADDVTDQSMRHLVEEIVREKLMRQIGDEIPHSAAVVVERYAEGAVTEIHADIYVERDSQKRIVIGQQGKRLKLIGSEARTEIETLIDGKVMLHLWVKVRKGWTNDPRLMARLGYR